MDDSLNVPPPCPKYPDSSHDSPTLRPSAPPEFEKCAPFLACLPCCNPAPVASWSWCFSIQKCLIKMSLWHVPGYKADIWKHGKCCEKTTVSTIEISAYELNWTRRPGAAKSDNGYVPSTWWYWLNRDQLVSDLLVATWQALTWLWSIFAESTFVIYIIYIIYIPHARCRLLTSTRYTVFQQSKNA